MPLSLSVCQLSSGQSKYVRILVDFGLLWSLASWFVVLLTWPNFLILFVPFITVPVLFSMSVSGSMKFCFTAFGPVPPDCFWIASQLHLCVYKVSDGSGMLQFHPPSPSDVVLDTHQLVPKVVSDESQPVLLVSPGHTSACFCRWRLSAGPGWFLCSWGDPEPCSCGVCQ